MSFKEQHLQCNISSNCLCFIKINQEYEESRLPCAVCVISSMLQFNLKRFPAVKGWALVILSISSHPGLFPVLFRRIAWHHKDLPLHCSVVLMYSLLWIWRNTKVSRSYIAYLTFIFMLPLNQQMLFLNVMFSVCNAEVK